MTLLLFTDCQKPKCSLFGCNAPWLTSLQTTTLAHLRSKTGEAWRHLWLCNEDGGCTRCIPSRIWRLRRQSQHVCSGEGVTGTVCVDDLVNFRRIDVHLRISFNKFCCSFVSSRNQQSITGGHHLCKVFFRPWIRFHIGQENRYPFTQAFLQMHSNALCFGTKGCVPAGEDVGHCRQTLFHLQLCPSESLVLPGQSAEATAGSEYLYTQRTQSVTS